MDQAVLMDAKIHKGAEVGDVRHTAFELHAFLKINDLFHVIAKLRRNKLAPRIAPGSIEFFADIGQRESSYVVFENFEIDRLHTLSVSDQLLQRYAERSGDLFDDRVRLRMHACLVERILSVLDTQEAGRLLECLVSETIDLVQLRP